MQLDPPSLYNIFIATLGPYTLFNEFVCFFLLFHKVLACVAIALVLIVLASNSPYVAIFSKYGFESLDLGDTFIDLWSAAPFLDSPIIPLSICAFSFFVFYLRMLPPPSTIFVAYSWFKLSTYALLSFALSVFAFHSSSESERTKLEGVAKGYRLLIHIIDCFICWFPSMHCKELRLPCVSTSRRCTRSVFAGSYYQFRI
jgi:hypothetical protein